MLERFRKQLEACDRLGWLSVCVDGYHGMGGLGVAYIESLLDEMLSSRTPLVRTRHVSLWGDHQEDVDGFCGDQAGGGP